MRYTTDDVIELHALLDDGGFSNLVGQKTGHLIVVGLAHSSGHGRSWWCECDCGNVVSIIESRILKGTVKSCGCQAHPGTGRDKNPLYKIWHGARSRCTNPSREEWPDYGGRGITMYEPWLHDFEAFESYVLSTIGPRPDGHQIDRVDNDGNYEPGNLRWATRSENNQNRRYAKAREVEALKEECALLRGQITELADRLAAVIVERDTAYYQLRETTQEILRAEH